MLLQCLYQLAKARPSEPFLIHSLTLQGHAHTLLSSLLGSTHEVPTAAAGQHLGAPEVRQAIDR